MKRLLISFIAAIICMCSFAQDATIHYPTFKGIELTPGITVKEVINGLEKTGCRFDKDVSTNDANILWGSFCNYDAKFFVLPCKSNHDIASVVAAQLPQRDSWKQLKADYDNMKSLLAKKYCIILEQEYFDDDYVASTTSDYLKLHALQSNECQFHSRFAISDDDNASVFGYIVLTISHVEVDYEHYNYVNVSYVTMANVAEQISSISDI